MDGEDIGQIAIVALRPQMRVVARVEQLRSYPHFVGRTLHAAFHDTRDAELLTDLTQIARGAGLVLHDAGAADHFEIRDLREVGQNLVLHPIGEEGVLFVLAQIFKRQHGDAFLGHSGPQRPAAAPFLDRRTQPRSPRRQGEAR